MRLLGPLGSGEDPKPLSPKPQNQKCTETLNPTAYKPMDSPSVSAETLGQERFAKAYLALAVGDLVPDRGTGPPRTLKGSGFIGFSVFRVLGLGCSGFWV